jgi:hypothetical protein
VSTHRQPQGGSRSAHQPLSLRIAAPLLLVVAISGCVTPARDDPQYRAKALAAVKAASSEVATAQMATGQRLRHRAFGTYADEVVTGDENALGSISAAFTAVQPPSHAADSIQDAVTGALSDAEDAVTQARVAIRRSDPAGMAAALHELGSVADDLSALQDRLQ